MATMKDVARRAGVSVGTVSNVLNNSATVQAENREKVMKAVAELGFRSNMVARTLKTKVSRDIGLIIPSISNPFYPEVARGVEDAANKAGLTVFLCNDDRNIEKERHYIESLLLKNVGGLILVKPQISLEEIDAVGQQIPVVLVDTGTNVSPNHSIVSVDDKSGISEGLKHLYKNGHRKIAFVRGLNDSLSSQNRVDAYVNFMESMGLPVRKEYIYRGNYDWNSGYSAARYLLDLDDPPTAIFTANDLMAIGCIRAAQMSGLTVPDDLSVIGFDNLDITDYCYPRLTTIDQPKYDMGVASVELLLRRMNHQNSGDAADKLTLPTTLIVRDSAGPIPVK